MPVSPAAAGANNTGFNDSEVQYTKTYATNTAAGAVALETVEGALKEIYTPERIRAVMYENNPFYALLPKDTTSFGGPYMVQPIQFATNQRRSQSFTDSQGQTSSAGVKAFHLTRVRDYAHAQLDAEAILATRGNAGSFLDFLTMEVDGAIYAMKRSLCRAVFGDGTGKLCKILGVGTGFSTNRRGPALADNNTFQTENVEDIVHFEVGQKLVVTNGGTNADGALRSGSMVVTKVDRVFGNVTVDSIVGSTSANDFVVPSGDAAQGNALVRISGLQRWLPSSVSANDNFFGVNRSVDRTRLAGLFVDGDKSNVHDSLIDASAILGREGGSPDVAICSYKTFVQLTKELTTKTGSDQRPYRIAAGDVPTIGFDGINMKTPTGDLTLLADPDCPADDVFLLQMNTWKLYSLGEAPHILSLDGLKMLRDASSDSLSLRMGFYGQLGCSRPSANCRIVLD
mgnify:CR=1 FL=1